MRLQPVHSKLTRTRSIFITASLALALTVLLGTVGAHVIATMRDSADAIDDHRAIRAAQAAISSLQKRVAGTVRDNAVWDEAYEAITKGDAVEWAYENWGKTSSDYPLYDGVVLTDVSGKTLSAYWKAETFDPEKAFGSQFALQQTRASRPGQAPVVSFFKVQQDIVLVASDAVQPFAVSTPDEKYNVLSFFKIIGRDVIEEIIQDHQLDGLRLLQAPPEALLNAPLPGFTGHPIAFLAWPTKAPGTAVYQQVYPSVVASIILLGIYVAGVVLAGSAEARRLRSIARQAQFHASHDSLTGLYNRFGLVDELKRHLDSPLKRDPLALHIVDLDGFKAINDAWGHAVGDELLVLVARELAYCHPEIVVAARLGGDEFAVLQVGPSAPSRIAAAILHTFEKPFQIEGRTIEVGASIGIARDEGLVDGPELLRRADMALYQAKDDGRARQVTYQEQLDVDRERIARLEEELRMALENDEIQPYFQPLVSAVSGELHGVEALARWCSQSGNISPEVFIPLAEKAGLIDALGLQMLRKSVRMVKPWSPLGLSVNVSPIQLCNPEFSAEIMSLLRAESFEPERLTLEITEGVLMSNPDQAKRAIDALKTAGIRFALDDFGCGYASIGALREFGFDRMKIDRSLVMAADEEGRGIDVLKATISLAAALGIPVTAEGIETAHQAEMLREAGCDQLQGYLVGRPMTGADLSLAVNDASGYRPRLEEISTAGSHWASDSPLRRSRLTVQ